MQGLVPCLAAAAAAFFLQAGTWQELEPGLEWREFTAPATEADAQPAVVRVLRIDPVHYSLVLGAAVADTSSLPRTVRSWCRDRGWAAAINAGMFQPNLRSVSYMRDGNLVVNPRVSKDKTILAFNRAAGADSLPDVAIIDTECADFDPVNSAYSTLVQSIRMLSCTGNNVWASRDQRYSLAAIGLDAAGRVLFIHIQAALDMHRAVDLLMELPLDLRQCLFAEGGAHAQLYVHSGDWEQELSGTGWIPLPVPNVVGVAARGP